jgi:hypothetical protein
LDQQRKATSENESSRPFKYSKGKDDTPNFDASQKQVHSIDSDGCGPPKNWDKNFRSPRQESENRAYDPRRDHQQSEMAIQAEAKAGAKIKKDLFIACSTRKTLTIAQGIALFS